MLEPLLSQGPHLIDLPKKFFKNIISTHNQGPRKLEPVATKGPRIKMLEPLCSQGPHLLEPPIKF